MANKIDLQVGQLDPANRERPQLVRTEEDPGNKRGEFGLEMPELDEDRGSEAYLLRRTPPFRKITHSVMEVDAECQIGDIENAELEKGIAQ
jgi:hypothetical protein